LSLLLAIEVGDDCLQNDVEGLVVQGTVFLRSYAPLPRKRLLAFPPFYASQFLSSYGIQVIEELAFSKVDLQDDR
jgi:hypothetical protein